MKRLLTPKQLLNLNRITAIVIFLATYGILLCLRSGMFQVIEARTLFLYDPHFIWNGMARPGGFLTMAGEFLTQFFWKPWLGLIFYSLLILLTVKATLRGGKIPEEWTLMAFLPAVLLFCITLGTDYYIYFMKNGGYIFTPLLGYSLCMLYMEKMRNLKAGRFFPAITVVSSTITYLLSGCWGLVAIFVTSLALLKGKRWLDAAVSMLCTAALPTAAARVFTDMTATGYWTTQLLIYPDKPVYNTLYIPLLILLAFMVALPLLPLKRWRINMKAMAALYISFLTLPVLFCFKERNFRAETLMLSATDRMEWQKVLEIHSKFTGSGSFEKSEPSRLMVELKNLALVKQRLEGEKAYTYRCGGKPQGSRELVSLMIQCGKQLYLHYGLINYSYRWCMEEAVEYGWGTGTARYSVMAAMLLGEWQMADKYLSLLEKTLFHKNWAKEQRELLAQTSKISSCPLYSDIIPLVCHQDKLDNDRTMIEPYLINYFTKQRPAGATAEFDRVALFWATLTQDIPSFWNCLANFSKTNPGRSLPRHYQEAALLYGSLEKKRGTDALPIDDMVKRSYSDFNKFTQAHPVTSMKRSTPIYYKEYGKTFYYFYYFMRNFNSY